MSGWREMRRSTPMRLTLRLVALFAAISLLSFAATWWMAGQTLLDAAEATLEQQIEALAATDDPETIARAVARAAAQADGDDLILRYDGPRGSSGNYAGPLPGGKLRLAELQDPDHDIDGLYVLRSKPVAGGVLTVGQDGEAFEELRETLITVLAYTLLPTVALALAGGIWIARRSARRLAAIETTLARLTAGDLTARLPALPGPRDDLTRLGAGIDRLAEAQEISVAALRQATSDIAHDLKTPIQRLALLIGDARAQAPDLAPLVQAEAEIAGIGAIFDALLRISQIEGGGARAHFAPVDLGALAQLMTELFTPAAEEGGHALTLELHQPATVSGDRTLLGQALANLIENALRHSPPGAVTIRVEHASLSVADHGPGIPAQERDAVLRRLYRLERSRTTPGSGLGLALVEAIARLHHGRLELFDNAPGLCVRLTLAALPADPR